MRTYITFYFAINVPKLNLNIEMGYNKENS